MSEKEILVVKNYCEGKQCSNCGECCTDILPLTKKEMRNIRSYIRKHNVKENVYMDEDTIDFRCPFYVKDSEKHCSIYPVRPEICRRFKCNQSSSYIELNKAMLSLHAYYNKFYNGSYHHSFITLHNLFYKNYEYELQAIFSLCNNNRDMAQTFINRECLHKYSIIEDDIEYDEDFERSWGPQDEEDYDEDVEEEEN